MKNDKDRKTIFQELMKLLGESMNASSAKGRAIGKIKTGKEKLKEIESSVPDKTEICDIGKLVDTASKTDAALGDLKSNEVELKKLSDVAREKREVFDTRLNAVIGNMSTDEGKATARDWGFYVQKCFVTGLVNANAFRYVDPRSADSLRQIAETYVQAHNALSKKVVYGVNPLSVQELNTELGKALTIAEKGLDPDKVQELRIAQGNLRKYGAHLLKMKVEKPAGMNQSASVQKKQASLIENASATMGQTMGTTSLPSIKGPKFTAARKPGVVKK